MRRLRQIEAEDFVGDGSADGYRQTHLLLFLEAFGRNHGVHGNDLRFLVRHFYSDGTFTRHRRDDTNTYCAE